ncbi:MAG: hypothetical protein ACSHXF_10310 [Aquaticitalea sp.]
MSELHNEIRTEDITYILEHPWALTEHEWNLHDTTLYAHAFSDVMRRLQLTVGDGYSKIWRTPSNEPIAILGGYKVDKTQFETFFIASHHMDANALKLSFDMRTILRENSDIYEGYTCGLYSTSEHPSQHTWFRFLGFKHVPAGDIENTRYFEYKAPRS